MDDVAIEYFPLFLAIDGDAADEFAGVPGVSKGTMNKFHKEIIEGVGPMEGVYERVKNGEDLFLENFRTNNKPVSKIIEHSETVAKNLKLCSYHALTDYLINTTDLSSYEKVKYIKGLMDDSKKIRNPQVLFDAFTSMSISLPVTENTIYNIFQ